MNYVCLVAMQINSGIEASRRSEGPRRRPREPRELHVDAGPMAASGGGYYGHRENNGQTPRDGGPLRINPIYIYICTLYSGYLLGPISPFKGLQQGG